MLMRSPLVGLSTANTRSSLSASRGAAVPTAVVAASKDGWFRWWGFGSLWWPGWSVEDVASRRQSCGSECGAGGQEGALRAGWGGSASARLLPVTCCASQGSRDARLLAVPAQHCHHRSSCAGRGAEWRAGSKAGTLLGAKTEGGNSTVRTRESCCEAAISMRESQPGAERRGGVRSCAGAVRLCAHPQRCPQCCARPPRGAQPPIPAAFPPCPALCRRSCRTAALFMPIISITSVSCLPGRNFFHRRRKVKFVQCL